MAFQPSGYSKEQFGHTVLNDFTRRRRGEVVEHALTASAGSESRALGHPLFEPLEVGQREATMMASVFLDLTNFTGRTFWDDPTEVADLAHAIITGFVDVVSVFGGYPLGMRGDGLFAGFGPGDHSATSTLALAACAFALNAIEEEVNPRLRERGIRPVQARAGVDYGELTFVRSGSLDRSEVNVIGFTANFAAKCEKTANSWEVIAGEGIASCLGPSALLTEHSKSPKEYQRDYYRRDYRFYDYHWRHTVPLLSRTIQQLNGHPAAAIAIR